MKERSSNIFPPINPVNLGYDTIPALLAAHDSIYGHLMSADETLYGLDTPDDVAFAEKHLKHRGTR